MDSVLRGRQGATSVIQLAAMHNFFLHENVTILIVKIATNRSMIELVNRSIGIRE